MGTNVKKQPAQSTKKTPAPANQAPRKPKGKQTLSRRFRRWKRRMNKRYPGFKNFIKVLYGLLIVAIAAILLFILLGVRDKKADNDTVSAPVITNEPAIVQTATPAVTSTPTPEPTHTPVPTPTATPEINTVSGLPEDYFYQTASAGMEYSDNSKNGLIKKQIVYVEGEAADNYLRQDEIHMLPSDEYSELEGVSTFRGSNYRDGGAYGTIPENPTKMTIQWTKRISDLGGWSGVGWTGQASAVRWPEETRLKMNIVDEKKHKDGLIECIYATLDGNIYFFDMEDGKATRKSIDIEAPIKGSVSIDPRGYPLLYCGQGIYDVDGKRVKCGTRVWSLFDQSLIWAINGNDKLALRKWQAFDCAPLVDAASDTMIQAGENGVLYTLKLNTKLSDNAISVEPETVRYVYDHSLKGQVGTENSIVCYNNYVYFANNSGIIQCVDLNTMELVWSVNAQDDIDASMALEVEESGLVALYAANELDKRGVRGTSQMFKINALTGELIWKTDSAPIYQHNENGGGSFASPGIGKNQLSGLVYFHVARTEEDGGTLYALNKESGSIVWEYAMGKYGWCSPTCVYTESGMGYVLVGSSDGALRLFDGLTGEVVAKADLERNIEATPVVFDDMIVVGTRGEKIFGIKIS